MVHINIVLNQFEENYEEFTGWLISPEKFRNSDFIQSILETFQEAQKKPNEYELVKRSLRSFLTEALNYLEISRIETRSENSNLKKLKEDIALTLGFDIGLDLLSSTYNPIVKIDTFKASNKSLSVLENILLSPDDTVIENLGAVWKIPQRMKVAQILLEGEKYDLTPMPNDSISLIRLLSLQDEFIMGKYSTPSLKNKAVVSQTKKILEDKIKEIAINNDMIFSPNIALSPRLNRILDIIYGKKVVNSDYTILNRLKVVQEELEKISQDTVRVDFDLVREIGEFSKKLDYWSKKVKRRKTKDTNALRKSLSNVNIVLRGTSAKIIEGLNEEEPIHPRIVSNDDRQVVRGEVSKSRHLIHNEVMYPILDRTNQGLLYVTAGFTNLGWRSRREVEVGSKEFTIDISKQAYIRREMINFFADNLRTLPQFRNQFEKGIKILLRKGLGEGGVPEDKEELRRLVDFDGRMKIMEFIKSIMSEVYTKSDVRDVNYLLTAFDLTSSLTELVVKGDFDIQEISHKAYSGLLERTGELRKSTNITVLSDFRSEHSELESRLLKQGIERTNPWVRGLLRVDRFGVPKHLKNYN